MDMVVGTTSRHGPVGAYGHCRRSSATAVACSQLKPGCVPFDRQPLTILLGQGRGEEGAVAQEEKVSVPPEAIYVLVVVRAICTFVEEYLVAFVYLSWLECRCGGACSQCIWRFN